MSDESAVSADNSAKKTPARRGPKKAEEIRAEVEAEMREQIEAEMRAKYEAELKAAKDAAENNKVVSDAVSATPITGFDIDGNPDEDGAMTVHFVDDGLTLLGKVWYRGEELTINPGTPNWDEARDVLVLDEFEQESRWGRRFFRAGPWRGKRLDEIDMSELTDAEKVQLTKASQIQAQRYGARA